MNVLKYIFNIRNEYNQNNNAVHMYILLLNALRIYKMNPSEKL